MIATVTARATAALLLLIGQLIAILTCSPSAVRLESSAWVMIQSSSSSSRTAHQSSRHHGHPSQTSSTSTRSRFSSSNRQKKTCPSHSALSLSTQASFSGDNSEDSATKQKKKISSSSSSTIDSEDHYTVEIRRCLYAHLPEAVDIIMSSYYAKMKNPWLQMYRLGELNRLQQNFPRMDHVNLHCMFVAIATATNHKTNADGNDSQSTTNSSIIGFCDVDGRTPNRPTGYAYNPRPYASDICVDPAFRRRGIGQQLVRACEDFARNVLCESQVYLRVEQKNKAAIQLYTGLGYKQIAEDDADALAATEDLASTTIILLCKQLNDDDEVEESSIVFSSSNAKTTNRDG
jgi:ribosomal protein S18 acetylase RimI-like enzyme